MGCILSTVPPFSSLNFCGHVAWDPADRFSFNVPKRGRESLGFILKHFRDLSVLPGHPLPNKRTCPRPFNLSTGFSVCYFHFNGHQCDFSFKKCFRLAYGWNPCFFFPYRLSCFKKSKEGEDFELKLMQNSNAQSLSCFLDV